MSYHVQRNGQAIGDFDERTLLSLLNAGTLRITDTYRARGMRAPEPLASLVGAPSARRAQALRLLAAIASLGMVAAMIGMGIQQTERPRMIEASGARAEPGEEIHRGYPVLHGTLMAGTQPALPDFPMQRVEQRAMHGRVAVLALDDKGTPVNFGSGFLTQDGLHVATALPLIKGAGSVEIWFENGRRVPATNVILEAETGVALLGIAEAGVGLDWSAAEPAEGEELFVAGPALLPSPVLARWQQAEPGSYKLATPLAASFLGAAVLDAGGDICAIVSQAETGTLLRSADIRPLLDKHKPEPISALAHLNAEPARLPVVVDSAEIEDGELVMQLRNTSGQAVSRALLHIRYHDRPPQADETASLERQLAATAVEVCTLEIEAPTSDLYLHKKQELRQVTAELEALRRLAPALLAPARQRLHRTDVVAVEATLPPGIPQRLTISAEAGSAWGVEVTVIDVLE